jgi:RNA polymerase sigma-70 factor (ECF subfamily)
MFFRKKCSLHSDEELMQKVHQGSEVALTEIYQRYSTPLMRYFTRMLWRDQQKAQDFLHDVFIKIIDNPQRFDGTRKFSTWIFSVAHNMCKNEYRRKSNHDRLNEFHINEEENVDLHDGIDKMMIKHRLDRMLDELDEEDKTLLLLRYEEELSIEQISEIVFLAEGTVKSRLFYLRKELAKKLIGYKEIFNEREA